MLGADPNTRLLGSDQKTALMYAIEENHLDLAHLLLQHGADPNARDDQGRTALTSAAWTGYTDIGRRLLDHGADPNAADRWGWTPLMCAINTGRLAFAALLLENGVDPHARTREGRTALMALNPSMSSENLGDALRLLIDRGDDPSAVDHAGHTLPQIFMEAAAMYPIGSSAARLRAAPVEILDAMLAHPARATARQRLLDRLTPDQRTAWLPRSCAAAAGHRAADRWPRQPHRP